MKKIKKFKVYKIVLILFIFLFTSIFIFSNRLEKNPYNNYKYVQDQYKIVTFTLPDTVYFAGQIVDLTDPYIRERVESELYSIAYFHSLLIKTIKQADRYLPYIEKELKHNKLPIDLKYIAIIESNLVPTTSPAGAKGIWQFMKGTAIKYGLEVNDDIDERLNFEKSTQAALTYLKDLYNMFGDWFLAIAAYNAGENYMKTKINEQYTNNFWDLVINAETARYISRAIATKLIFQSFKNFGFYIPTTEIYPPYKYKEIVVDTTITNLPLFCKQMNISYYNFKKLNPWLVSDKLVNSSKKKYIIRIPISERYQMNKSMHYDSLELIERI